MNIKNIIYANYATLAFVTGGIGMFMIQSLPSIFKLNGVQESSIGWFFYIALFPWVLKIFFSKYIEYLRIHYDNVVYKIILSSNFCVLICIGFLAVLKPSDSIILFGIICFILNTCISISFIALSGQAIDNLPKSHTSLNVILVLCETTSGLLGVYTFLKIYIEYSWHTSLLILAIMIIIASLPALFLRSQATKKTLEITHHPILYKTLQNKYIQKNIFLVLSSNIGLRLGTMMIGVFLSSGVLPKESIPNLLGFYGPISSLIGCGLGYIMHKKISLKVCIAILLACELFLFIGFFISRNPDILTMLYIILSIVTSAKFISVYSFMMYVSKGKQSCMDFSILQSFESLLALITSVIGGYIISLVNYGFFFGLCASLSLLGFCVFMTQKKHYLKLS